MCFKKGVYDDEKDEASKRTKARVESCRLSMPKSERERDEEGKREKRKEQREAQSQKDHSRSIKEPAVIDIISMLHSKGAG